MKYVRFLYSDLPPVRVGGRKLVGRVLFGLLVAASAMIGAFSGLLIVYSTELPQISELERYRPSTTTELYDDQGRVVASFALQKRIIAQYDDFPKILRDAVISIEDKDFERHWGVDFWRVIGAGYRDLTSGSRTQGASTLTMQLSRNLFLTFDKSWHRKIQETMLSLQIERRFTKAQIFTLYANQIYFGHGIYGFQAASEYYFNKRAKDLTLEEAALLAAVPKGPSLYSPIVSPERALRRRNLVLNSMLEDGKITAEQASHAKATPLTLHLQSGGTSAAPYFAEEIRRYLEKKYGSEEVHTGGLRVYTSLNLDWQRTANQAVLEALSAYEHRHGWKGHLRNVIALGSNTATDLERYDDPSWVDGFSAGAYTHAMVLKIDGTSALVKLGPYRATLAAADMKWPGHKSPAELLSKGDIAYVKILAVNPDGSAKVTLEQDSGTQGALLAIDNSTGDIKAMVGGRDFHESKFNRATQALRQVGSSFKPYVYTTAIEDGMTPDDVVVDAPTVFRTASGPYMPHNYDGKYEGRITLRRALAQSRNIPALKITEQIGIRSVIETARRFGITSTLPPYLPVALGSAEITLFEQTAAFSTFPNDGVRVAPRYIRKVTDYDGRLLEEDYPEVKDVIAPRTARIMTAMLREVATHGTAASAAQLKHPLAGKTGTTNDFTDAWFVGFSPSITCGVWIGYDEKKSLGNKETGSMAALPAWIQFMRVALAGRDAEDFMAPPLTPTALAKVDTPDHRPGDGEAH